MNEAKKRYVLKSVMMKVAYNLQNSNENLFKNVLKRAKDSEWEELPFDYSLDKFKEDYLEYEFKVVLGEEEDSLYDYHELYDSGNEPDMILKLAETARDLLEEANESNSEFLKAVATSLVVGITATIAGISSSEGDQGIDFLIRNVEALKILKDIQENF